MKAGRQINFDASQSDISDDLRLSSNSLHSITKTCPCNVQIFLKLLKMKIFSRIFSSPEPKAHR